MYFKQFYLSCLAHASYLIGSNGEAVVVDPQRDVDQYISEAEAHGLSIKYVIETHLHADFVSGHRELAERTGAEIVFGEKAGAAFPHMAVRDGDEISVGNVTLHVLETPGHTPEGISILVADAEISDKPQKVLTGDTLFIGDVGRPDLAGGKGFTSEMMAAMMYDSLHDKLLKLNDDVEVYPAHGAGSSCGRNISKETSSTIGQQRAFNYALQPMSKEAFVAMMTTDMPAAPAYFPHDAEYNRIGASRLDELQRPAALSPAEISNLMHQGYQVLDVRSAADYGAGHISGALNIGHGGQFASWAGTLIPIDTPLIIVGNTDANIDEATMRLARVGIESVKGFLSGGMGAWASASYEIALIEQVSVQELRDRIDKTGDLRVFDVRRPAEYSDGHVPGAESFPLGPQLSRCVNDLNKARTTAVICAGGYRSSAATSILETNGFHHLLNVTGGTNAWVSAGYEVEL